MIRHAALRFTSVGRGHPRAASLLSTVAVMLLASAAWGQNVIVNGGFESGNTAFMSDYGYTAGGNCCAGQYTVRGNGSSFNGAFVNPPPSSAGSLLMMVINGSTVPNQRIWFQTVPVTPGVTYRLALRGCTAVAGGPAVLRWQIDGAMIGQSKTLSAVTGVWAGLDAAWTAPAGTTSIVLAVRNLNTQSFPNDFYLDDFSMERVPCGSTDFDGDGDEGTDADIEAFFAVLAGGACPTGTCGSIDFDGDGDEGTDADIEAFFRAIAGGDC